MLQFLAQTIFDSKIMLYKGRIYGIFQKTPESDYISNWIVFLCGHSG